MKWCDGGAMLWCLGRIVVSCLGYGVGWRWWWKSAVVRVTVQLGRAADGGAKGLWDGVMLG